MEENPAFSVMMRVLNLDSRKLSGESTRTFHDEGLLSVLTPNTVTETLLTGNKMTKDCKDIPATDLGIKRDGTSYQLTEEEKSLSHGSCNAVLEMRSQIMNQPVSVENPTIFLDPLQIRTFVMDM